MDRDARKRRAGRETEARRDRDAVERAVLEFVRDPTYRPTSARELVRAMRIPRERQADVRRLVRSMIRAGRLVRISGRRVVAGGPEGALVGVLERRRDGRAVVAPVSGSDPVEIPERVLAGAHEGDTVAVRITAPARPGARASGAVVEILARERGARLGVVTRAGRGWEVRPFEADGDVLALPASFRQGAGPDDVVRYEPLPGKAGEREGRVLEVLGPVDGPGIDVEVVCRRHGLRTDFPAEVARDVARLPAAVPADEAGRRERFDDPPPVTIDGETAKDFDDAIAVARLPRGGWRVYVHIADVAWFVRTGSALDREASARGTSTYFPDRVVPMLPPRLSDDLCSLRPDEDRLVQTAVIDLDRDGAVLRHRIADGVIRSRARLTYTQVADALEGRRGHGVPKGILAMLREADRVREALEARRAARGSVDFDLPEPQIQVDLEGVMTGVAIRPRNRAHRLIEGLMLLANETVAGRLEERGLPCLYRIHEVPDPAKIEALGEFAAKFGLAWAPAGDEVVPGDVQRLLAGVEGRPEYPVVAQVALRSMKQARYAVDNVGHFGLAAPVYAHFTSPIRRYPDLVVHRIARASRRGGRVDEPASDALPEVAAACSTLERNAEAAERELLEWKKIAFMRDRVGDDFDGIVTGIAAFGCFVRLTESLVEGLLRVDRLGGEWFDFDEGRMELRARGGDRAYTLGDRLRVRVDRVDVPLRRVELSLAGSGPPAPPPRRRGPGRRPAPGPGRRGRNAGRRRRQPT